jgi:nitroimidazol reductase NimA-like FMN-containing flavoprotein (pyridoxamine 5'-phosphate oxidase superfamily)
MPREPIRERLTVLQEVGMAGAESPASLRELSQEECYRLLATQQIGRLGVNAENYPLIFPVNYALDDEVVVFRSNAGLKLTAADHANVTFEVDDIDPFRRTGWSIVIRGLAEEVTRDHRDELIARTAATGVEPWAPGDRGHWLRIIPHKVTGRLIVPGELPPAFEDHGYL